MDLHMKLGDNGEAFFVQETEEESVSVVATFPLYRNFMYRILLAGNRKQQKKIYSFIWTLLLKKKKKS